MVTIATDKRVLNYKEAKAKFDGHWFLMDQRDFPPEEDKGYVVAYGDGTAEDREALRKINFDKYHGEVFLLKGYMQKDEIFDSGIIEIV